MQPDRARRYPLLPGSGPPFEIAGTEGCFLITPDGRRILDAAGGAIVSNIGHGRAEVAEVAARAMARVTYVVPPFATDSRVSLVERLQDRWLPAPDYRAVFTSGGSESVDLAMRVARQHFVAKGEPGRFKIIGRDLSYHGTTLATLSAGGHLKRRKGLGPMLSEHPKAPACYPLRCGLCRGSCDLQCADAVEALIRREGPETVAAFVAEPITGSTIGAVVPPDEYWPRLAETCRRHGVLLIADEVMSGFGRTGRRFAVDHWDVKPDLLAGGKGLAGGYLPMGAVFARESVVAPIAARGDDVMFYTFSAQDVCCAVADRVLDIMEREELVERAARMGERLSERLAQLREHPHVAEIRGRGLLQAIELVKDKQTLEPFPESDRLAGKLVAAGLAHGVFFYPGGCGPAPDVVCFGPPFVISEDEIDLLVTVFEKALGDALAGTFL